MLAVLCVAGGCSRPSSSEGSAATGATSSPLLLPPPPAPASVVVPQTSAASANPVLTPEDAEDSAAHRITDQNLESELDRLEREIQAE